MTLPRLLLLSLFSLAAIAQEGVTASKSETVATLTDTRIKESSGIARSLRHDGIFWTHNDSGGEPCVFAIDLQGRTRAKVRLRDAVNFDWEDMTSGLDENGVPCLFVGDIGDNLFIRRSVQVYRILEPNIAPAGQPAAETISPQPQVWHVSYPNGSQNAESLLIHPKTGRIHILTKSNEGKSALYGFPAALTQKKGEPLILEKITDITFTGEERTGKRHVDDRMCTGAAFAPDGHHLVAATYSSLYEWTLPEGQTLAEALAKKPARLLPELVRQLEAVCYGADSRTLWITSEHLPTPLIRITRD